MLKKSKKTGPLHNCYGCDCLFYDATKPLLDGYCSFFRKSVRVVGTTEGFYHMQISECLGYDDKIV